MGGSPREIYQEAYPARVLCLSLGHMAFSYALGLLIMHQIHPLLGPTFLALCVASLVAGLRHRCRFCFYFGKTCYVGLGKLAAILYEPGDSQEFAKPHNLTLPAVLSFTVLLLPLITIVAVTAFRFSWLNLTLLSIYLLLVVFLGFTMRKSRFCDRCRQAELGCPAYEGMCGRKG